MKEQEWIDEVIKKIIDKMEWVSEKNKHKIPYTTINGNYDNKDEDNSEWDKDNGINWWTNGFWSGILWQMNYLTGQEHYAQKATIAEEKLDRCFSLFEGLHHDVGFMWIPSSVTNYRLTGNYHSRIRALHAANLLAARFNHNGKFIRAWNDIPGSDKDTRGWAIIDSLLNIPILYWATKETGDPRFEQIARQHADTIMNNFIRPDGSSYHIVEFDYNNGNFIKGHRGQGYDDMSSWTRGQAWALYGLALSYKHTGRMEYLYKAQEVAHYFIANIPESNLIPVDFRQPNEIRWEDSAATAIAASGMLEIAQHVTENDKHIYINIATRLLNKLSEIRVDWSKEQDNILNNCTGAYHDKEHHFAMVYGDYYYIEAILKLKNKAFSIW